MLTAMQDTASTTAAATSISSGLSSHDAAQRLHRDGPNALATDGRRGILAIIADTAREPMFLLLLGAGTIYLLTGDTREALVLLARMPMKLAVGTSLFIIAAKSLIGFIGDLQGSEVIDWKLLGIFTGFAVAGIFLGIYLSKKIHGDKLKKAFGWFVLIMGIYIIIKEIFFQSAGGH